MTEAAGDLRHDEPRLRFLVAVGEALSSSLDYQTTLNSVARLATPFLADLCVIDIPDGDIARPIAIAHIDPEGEALVREMRRRFPVALDGDAPVARVMRSGASLLIPDVSADLQASISQADEHFRILESLNYRSAVVVPIHAHRATVGTIMLISVNPARRFDHSDLSLAEEFAARAADAVDNARLFAAEQSARQTAEAAVARVERLLDVTEALSRALTPAEVAQVVIEQTFAGLGAARSFVMRLDDTGRTIELVSEHGLPADQVGAWARLPIERDVPVTEVVRSGRPLWLPTREERFRRYPLVAHSPTASAGGTAAIPLVVNDRVTGVLGIAFDEERELSEAERSFLLVLARQCAQALERTRLFAAERAAREQAERVNRRMARLQVATSALSRALTAGDVSQIVLREAIDMLGATVGSILLLSEDGEALEMAGQIDYPEEVLAGWHRVPLSLHVQATEAFLSGAPVWIRSRAEAVERYPVLTSVRTTGANAFAAIPLIADDATVGVMGLSFAEARDFNEEDQGFLTLLAQQGALALERARLFDAEQRARTLAEQAVRAREEFLSIAAHELRTPLTSVKGFAQMLVRQLNSPAANPSRLGGFARSLDAQVLRLEALVSDLLDITRIEQGRLTPRRAPADLAEIAARGVAQFESAPERGPEHTLTLDAPEPAHGVWDAGRIEQALVNLISNALKYSPEGGPVEVRVWSAGPDALVSVSDRGIGIAPADRERLFEPFTRAAGARDTASGTGLGLYITARIVDAHGGSIAVESAPGGGSVFTIRLPREAPAAPESSTSGEDHGLGRP